MVFKTINPRRTHLRLSWAALCAALLLLVSSVTLGAETNALLPRLLATLPEEPMLAIAVADARALPEKFAATNLSKMLNDPSYAKGSAALTQLIQTKIGGNGSALWANLAPQLSGPIVLAVFASKISQVELVVLVPTAEAAEQVRLAWLKLIPPESERGSFLELRTVIADALPTAEKVPEWANETSWQPGDISLRMLPVKLGAALLASSKDKNPAGVLSKAKSFWQDLNESELSALALGIKFDGEWFSEQLQVKTEAKPESAFGRVVQAIRANPGSWDGLEAAMPGGPDVLLMAQADLKAMQGDEVYFCQALERYLRGKKWTRLNGLAPESLDKKRYDFILNRLSGSVGVAGRPALTGDLRLVVATATQGGGDAETVRAELQEGLGNLGAPFETLPKAAKIGAAAPLGAAFQGRGLFGAPLVGLSPGWAWLCSNSGAYNDLLTAFRTGNTLASGEARAKARPSYRSPWHEGDAFRVQINLNKLVMIAYAAWMLSGDAGIGFGGLSLPAEMLPPPQLFTGRLGGLSAGLGRTGTVLNGYSTAVLPGSSVLLLVGLQELAGEINAARVFSIRRAIPLSTEPENVLPPENIVPQENKN